MFSNGVGFALFFIIMLVMRSPGNLIQDAVGENVLQKQDARRIVLLGASIGRHWDFPALPERVGIDDYICEYIGGGGPDKSNNLLRVLSRKEDRPHAILLKECAAFFPADLEVYKKYIRKWVDQCLNEGVHPVPVTVVPVTRLHPFKQVLIDILKRRNPLRFGSPFKNSRNKNILEFNDWIRDFCKRNNLAVLDLEKAVRYSGSNRYLREDYARIDGLHLNSKGYRQIDKIFLPTMSSIPWDRFR